MGALGKTTAKQCSNACKYLGGNNMANWLQSRPHIDIQQLWDWCGEREPCRELVSNPLWEGKKGTLIICKDSFVGAWPSPPGLDAAWPRQWLSASCLTEPQHPWALLRCLLAHSTSDLGMQNTLGKQGSRGCHRHCWGKAAPVDSRLNWHSSLCLQNPLVFMRKCLQIGTYCWALHMFSSELCW